MCPLSFGKRINHTSTLPPFSWLNEFLRRLYQKQIRIESLTELFRLHMNEKYPVIHVFDLFCRNLTVFVDPFLMLMMKHIDML